ncbi:MULTISPECIES: molybdenum cofactor cytidylyltransferase [Escherichia]|uniref:molybdenum cofactor cytidylyltransferase n=1 Tax=Escherichia TaxID=561 RepID=UPI0002BC1CAE|nr:MULTISPECIES: molybdenum cofactor cytidylyltransferase [Escherichia]EFB2830722.1 molybdenum cofactor cytidylyltransferase [Escherichia coli]MBY7620406.1 molybdenum cofactor cytidylyltransferase [Escherichia marmotae]EFK3893088.1 molybdenum cofactor cytidylyltransferase [Escherichia coli]EFO2097223.1 molybdenum cofactor cytidylyltransferase [Escherichia coli]MBA0991184.1 molybdenum cofactor cytidylyltransferase [Escherichia coli]
MSAIDCIITAAGLSSRMGQWKMMLPWQQETILDASIKNALQFCSRIILVTGFRANELHHRYENTDNITLIYNPDYEQGLLTSVKAAAPEVQTEHCFITHGDMPSINANIFNKIWQLRNDGAILPLHNGIPGHPILISKSSLMQAIQRPNVTNMRQALQMGEHYSVEIEDEEIILDIDTPEDFIYAQKRHTKF